SAGAGSELLRAAAHLAPAPDGGGSTVEQPGLAPSPLLRDLACALAGRQPVGAAARPAVRLRCAEPYGHGHGRGAQSRFGEQAALLVVGRRASLRADPARRGAAHHGGRWWRILASGSHAPRAALEGRSRVADGRPVPATVAAGAVEGDARQFRI